MYVVGIHAGDVPARIDEMRWIVRAAAPHLSDEGKRAVRDYVKARAKELFSGVKFVTGARPDPEE